jgi:MFS family permease
MIPLSGLQNIVRALKNPNFRIYTAGSAVSLVGTWMQRVVTGWLTWELTGSGAWLGLVVFADLFPTVVIGPIAGAYADRNDRLRVTKISQTLAMVQAVMLFGLTVTGLINIWLLLALTLFLGVVAAFNQPARLALIPALVPPGDLTAAVAVNSVVFNLARFIGPAAAGLIIATVGIPIAYGVNALTFVAFLIALSRVRLSEPDGLRPMRGKLTSDLLAGIRYTASHTGIATVLIMMIAANVGARPLIELLPGFAAGVFHAGATGLALLTSAVGAGAIIAGLWLAGVSGGRSLGRAFLANTVISALAGVLFALTDNLWIAVPLLVVNGFAMAGMGISAQTLIQISVDASMRGRVLSLFGLIFRGGPALGALIMGAASDYVGLRLPIFLGAVVVLAVWLWARPRQSHIAGDLGPPQETPPQGRD